MLFVYIYRFFNKHKWLLYSLLIISSIIFIFFGLKAQYEEDLAKLLPSVDKSESGLVFGNLKVKDKIFIQITGDTPEKLIEYTDELMDSVLQSDEDIANTLYKIDDDMAVNALYYVLDHIPSFVDTNLYASFDQAIDHAEGTMSKNYEMIMNDEEGNVTQMVTTDPLNLRKYLLPDLSNGMGFNIIDHHLFSHDSTVALIFISPNFQSFNSKNSIHLLSRIENHINTILAKHPNVQIHMHGLPIRSVGNSRTMKKDIVGTIGISLLIILIILCISFKNGHIIWQNLLPVIYGTFFALACMYWIKGGMSLMALGISSVILGVALSYCLHIIVHLHFVGNIEQMLKEESTSICLGCLTTIGAFIGLLFTQSDLLKDFGLFSTFMLIGNTLFALIFLPHFLKNNTHTHHQKIFYAIEKINNYPYDRKPLLIGALVIIIIVGIIFSPKVEFDNNLKNIGYVSEKSLQSETLYTEKNIQGELQRYYAAVAPTLDEALTYNKALSRMLDSLYKAKTIASYTPLVSILFHSEEEQQQRIAAWNNYWTAEKQKQAVQAVHNAAIQNNLDPNIFTPFQAMLNNEYTSGDLYAEEIVPEGLLCNFIEKSNDKFLIFNAVQIGKDQKDSLDKMVVALPHTVVVDQMYYTGNMISLIRQDFSTTLWISSVFVFIVLLLAFKDMLIALVAFMPMFFSWYVVQGWMAIFGLPFNLINIVISTFIFGIGVDYSIFVMQGLINGLHDKENKLLEYHKIAIFLSAFVLIIVVIAMLLATHPAIKSIGTSTLIGMISTILITYTLQPLCYRYLIKIPFVKRRILKKFTDKKTE
ncbi:MAG: MMPL family transporter [Bacteroidales bacterium]|nr:MMPL family transporter [Bacteroidales bacterium]